MEPKFLLAVGVICLLLGLFTAALIVGAYGEIKGTYHYPVPPVLVEFCRECIASALVVLTLGYRAKVNKDKKDKE